MPQIIPIKDLKNTSVISQMCREAQEPIYITKNGYSDMVIMSARLYEEKLFLMDVHSKLKASETQIAEGKVMDADKSLALIRGEFDV